MVLGQEIRSTAIGLAVGLVCAIPASMLLTKLLFQVRTSDPESYIASVLVISGAAFIATILPAWRIAKISPSDVLCRRDTPGR
jgi:ABC-type antimicrobial peptide transport system permease subunit